MFFLYHWVLEAVKVTGREENENICIWNHKTEPTVTKTTLKIPDALCVGFISPSELWDSLKMMSSPVKSWLPAWCNRFCLWPICSLAKRDFGSPDYCHMSLRLQVKQIRDGNPAEDTRRRQSKRFLYKKFLLNNWMNTFYVFPFIDQLGTHYVPRIGCCGGCVFPEPLCEF